MQRVRVLGWSLLECPAIRLHVSARARHRTRGALRAQQRVRVLQTQRGSAVRAAR